jgi:hypothetical protein
MTLTRNQCDGVEPRMLSHARCTQVSRRQIALRQNGADVAQVDVRGFAFVRTFREVEQPVRDPRQQVAKLDFRQAH